MDIDKCKKSTFCHREPYDVSRESKTVEYLVNAIHKCGAYPHVGNQITQLDAMPNYGESVRVITRG